MYQKYQTDALILGSRETGESDKTLTLFTEEFGLVRARASGIRKETSRMRYGLQDYTRSAVALVRGKRAWRLAGANVIRGTEGNRRGIQTFARIASLVTRLVQGEEKNEYLFAALAEAQGALVQEKGEAYGTIELVCVARILYALGYISTEALSTALFTHTAYTGESLVEAETMKDKLLSSVNKAIAETQL